MNDIYAGEEYQVDPSSVRFDQEMVEFNRMHNAGEYEATKLSIQAIGQLSPIEINNKTGLCENGRHRVKICTELNIPVKCKQIDGDTPKEVRLEIYNMEAMSGRDLNTAQRGIQAHKFALTTGESLEKCAIKFKTNKRAATAANVIAGLGRSDVLNILSEDGEWMIPGKTRPSKDLRAIAKYLTSLSEELEEVGDSGVKIDYEDMINTERGKSEFWGLRNVTDISIHEKNLMIVELLNLKYRIKVNNDTGEVTE